MVGQRYTAVQYGAGGLLVAGISLFTAGDAAGGKESSSTVTGVVLISIALVGQKHRGQQEGEGAGAPLRAYLLGNVGPGLG